MDRSNPGMLHGSAPTGPLRYTVIVNPVARRNVERVVQALHHYAPPHIQLLVLRTDGPGAAQRLAQEALATTDMIIAVGGDGTVSEIAAALAGSRVALGIIPCGSTNIIARELRIPTQTMAAVRLVLGTYALRCIDVGHCGERCVVHMAGSGLDSMMFADTKLSWKRRVGWLAYIPTAARHLFRPPVRYVVTTEREQVTVWSRLVLVANGKSIATPTLQLHPDIRHADGLLDVFIFTPISVLQTLRTMARLATRTLTRSPFVVYRQAKSVHIDASPGASVEIDGDVCAITPVAFTIVPDALNIVVPG